MKKGIEIPIRRDELVTVTQAGKRTKVTYVRHRNTKKTITKIDKDHYTISSDENGVVHEYKHNENRMKSPDAVRRTLNNLNDIINANISDISRCKCVTLTYAENMTDLKRLEDDWENFRKKARRKWGNFEYIKVKEPQGRGAWHWHIIMIFESKAPFMDSAELNKLWGKGYVKVKNMKYGVDYGLYFTASLKDMTKSEAQKAGIDVDSNNPTSDKKYVKGARLSLYPNNIRIFCCSNGIKKPVKSTMTKAQADLIVQSKQKVGQYNSVILNDNNQCLNVISVTKYTDK